jgi:hypothetical protein
LAGLTRFAKENAGPRIVLPLQFNDVGLNRCQTRFDIFIGKLPLAQGIKVSRVDDAFFNQRSIGMVETGAAPGAAGPAAGTGITLFVNFRHFGHLLFETSQRIKCIADYMHAFQSAL